MAPEDLWKVLDNVRAKFAERELLKQKRGWRDKVDPLTLEYEDYRKTKLWKDIKGRVLNRDGHRCRRCEGKAALVHHLTYSKDVMLGRDDSGLVSLCDGCHQIVHFTSVGVLRSAEEQLAALWDLGFDEVLPKVDMRMNPFRRPIWARLTVAQKSAYLSEYNARKRESSRRRPAGVGQVEPAHDPQRNELG